MDCLYFMVLVEFVVVFFNKFLDLSISSNRNKKSDYDHHVSKASPAHTLNND